MVWVPGQAWRAQALPASEYIACAMLCHVPSRWAVWQGHCFCLSRLLDLHCLVT